jgi:hypothetical protein
MSKYEYSHPYCESCCYYYPILVQEDGRGSGDCQRYPPIPLEATGPGPRELTWSEWPSVNSANWCGEYKKGDFKDK